MKRLIESTLPVDVLSRDAAIEMSFKSSPAYWARCRELGVRPEKRTFHDPKIRNLLPWLARRPRSVARAINLAAILQIDTSIEEFLRLIGFSKEHVQEVVSQGMPPLISHTRPEIDLSGYVIADLMAGGGSIPLESVTLGADTIGCDYNPVSFLILKATVDWPARFGESLYEGVTQEARSLINHLKEQVGRFYAEDDQGYLIVRQVINSEGKTPLTDSIRISKNDAVCMQGSAGGKELDDTWINQHKNLMEGHLDLLATHRISVVLEKRGFRLPTNKDFQRFEQAAEEYLKLSASAVLVDGELPKGSKVFAKVARLDRYRYLFNPRQALVLEVASRYLVERSRELQRSAGELGAAVATYLAFGICRLADFNSILTSWNHYQRTVRDAVGAYYRFREFRLEPTYAEAVAPYRTIEWIFETDAQHGTAGGICPALKELVRATKRQRIPRIRIAMLDATKVPDELHGVADVVNIDPPYYDVHQYGEFSDFFWTILRCTLGEVREQIFEGNILFEWSPSEERVPKCNEIASEDRTVFGSRLSKALTEAYKVLKKDGILVLWFSHKSIKAWEEVAGSLKNSGYAVTNVIPIAVEHPTRSVTKGGQKGINRVLVVVARKKQSLDRGDTDYSAMFSKFSAMLEKARIMPSEVISTSEQELLRKALEVMISMTKKNV